MNHQAESALLGKGAGVISAFVLAFVFLSISKLDAQQIISRDIADYPNGSTSLECVSVPFAGCAIVLPPAKYGESYSFTIPTLQSISRSDVTFSFTQKNGCDEGSISYTPDGRIDIGSASGCRPKNNSFIEISLKATSGDVKDSLKYFLPILREPINIVFALDMSASMSLPIPGGTHSRWDILKNAVELFTQKMQAFRHDGDLLGVTYFSTGAIQPGSPLSANLIEITSESAPNRTASIIRNDLASSMPVFHTAMGNGLLSAKRMLFNSNSLDARKVVLLVSDGQQNIEPLVYPDGNTLSAGDDQLNTGPCSAMDSVRYYSVGMGGTTLDLETMGRIAQASGGTSLHVATSNEDDEFGHLFQNQHASIFEEQGVQVVAKKTGVLSTSGTTYRLPVNANVSKLFFELVTQTPKDANITIEKDGKDITPFAIITEGQFYKTLSLALPIAVPEITRTEGDWLVTVRGGGTSKYSFACYADDNLLSFTCKPSKSVYTVGEKLNLSVNLSFAGNPLSGNSNKVQVMLIKPGYDLGDLLAKSKFNPKDSINDVESSAYVKFIELAKNDKAFINRIKPKSHIIDLDDAGEGNFTAIYNDTELTGVYQLVFMVNGQIPGFGSFERQKQYSVVFKFGQINASKSDIKAIITPSKQDVNDAKATVTFRPKNEFGYYLGPGFLSRIKLSVDSNQGKVISSNDNLDGSYTYIISNIPKNVKPDLRIMVMDEILYLGKFPSPKLYVWQFLVLVALIIALIIRYIFAHTGFKLLRLILLILLILWVIFMVLQRLGIIIF